METVGFHPLGTAHNDSARKNAVRTAPYYGPLVEAASVCAGVRKAPGEKTKRSREFSFTLPSAKKEPLQDLGVMERWITFTEAVSWLTEVHDEAEAASMKWYCANGYGPLTDREE